MRMRLMVNIIFATLCFACVNVVAQDSNMRLASWERGVSVQPISEPDMRVYLWFYEWHMFDAVNRGQHTRGAWKNRITIRKDGKLATVESSNPGITLEITPVRDGAEMKLTIVNRSRHEWPPLASIIACFNPGPEATRNRQFANTNTWFHAADGLQRLAMRAPREIHYNHKLRAEIDAAADNDGRHAWTAKWPKSQVDAIEGLIIRESTDNRWVTAIAWERFLSAQGHNPWECMHLSIHVGPLARDATRVVRGKIYLLEGSKDDALSRYHADFRR
ncbi:MAG: hypothetical protein QGF59_31415 [Pirellulaceae bacterium]|jgi:hypothetical protein|nr:hypothetical protein [Pirellulaceae bacterium]MDP6723213.1 hypothetical protein [Pirellulaceae bacterium]